MIDIGSSKIDVMYIVFLPNIFNEVLTIYM
jgi:hypothetical protein